MSWNSHSRSHRRRSFRIAALLNLQMALLLGVLAALPQPAWAGSTGKISGKVVNGQTKEVLAGVNVLVVGTTMGAATDAQGEFFVANIPAGTYSLKASVIGYAPVTMTGVLVHADATTEVAFTMQESDIQVGEVVVSAPRPPVQKDNTASVITLDAKDVTSRTPNNLQTVLSELPSVNFENGALVVRGGSLDQVAFIIDGARVRNPLDQTPYTNVNLGSIQEMQVITGSYNAEYGEAQSGVFNIITKEGGPKYSFYTDVRFTPPGNKLRGPALYDPSTPLYWENSHARHVEWWIQFPDQWVDPNGIKGSDPRCSWTPEQAYQNYMATHQPLTSYTKIPSYQSEVSIGGPIPQVDNLFFFVSGKYRSQAPYLGNSFVSRGEFFDGTGKVTYQLSSGMKLQFSALFSTDHTSWGVDNYSDDYYFSSFATKSRYAYFDQAGLPWDQTDGETIKFTHVLDPSSMYELKLSKVHAIRRNDIFPNDPIGFSATGATYDYIRAVDANGDPIPGAYQDAIGFHTNGYYSRYDDSNTDWSFTGFYSSQMNKNWELKAGVEGTYYVLDHFNMSKLPDRVENRTYNPYQGAVYAQNKLEFGGMIVNAGLRFDFYNPHDLVYTNVFDPFNSSTSKTSMFTQLSPRLGISHPIDENTVLHFSYGHFFERSSFGDYGEGNGYVAGNLTTFIVTATGQPWILGNRLLKPQKTVSYEVGVERNFADLFVMDVTGFYKDISNLTEFVLVQLPNGSSYGTNGNAAYGDVRGLEISLRRQPTHAISGYLNFTTQLAINGVSGDPNVISVTSVKNPGSGDIIYHKDPRLKAGLLFQVPRDWTFLEGALTGVSISVDYQAIFPNDGVPGDYFNYQGQKYLRPVQQNTDLKVLKNFSLLNGGLNVGAYVVVSNLFDNTWVNVSGMQTSVSLSPADQAKFVQSNFSFVPSVDVNGNPIAEQLIYLNLPRSVQFGVTIEL